MELVLLVVTFGFAFVIGKAWEGCPIQQTAIGMLCYRATFPSVGKFAAGAFFVVILVLGEGMIFSNKERFENILPIQKGREFLPWVASWLGFFAMWIAFAYIIHIRVLTRRVTGSSYLENQWGFGQTLTLGTWASVFVDFGYLYLCKCKLGIQVVSKLTLLFIVDSDSSSDQGSYQEMNSTDNHRGVWRGD